MAYILLVSHPRCVCLSVLGNSYSSVGNQQLWTDDWNILHASYVCVCIQLFCRYTIVLCCFYRGWVSMIQTYHSLEVKLIVEMIVRTTFYRLKNTLNMYRVYVVLS